MNTFLHQFAKSNDWLTSKNSFSLIAGPCSLESEEQIHSTVQEIAKNGVDMIRAGIWKPRTNPGCFEGIGKGGLKWLKEAGNEVGLPVTCEVATPEHVEACLKEGIDTLWIGARTTVNPFSVQAIADSLSGVDIPVMVKNPICPELALWIGGIERLYRAGITKISAIHRGFSTTEKDAYRYSPVWEIPLKLKQKLPDLPIICDPSHICGKRNLIENVALTALAYGFDGLMLESHVNPDKALSDAKQQLLPAQLSNLIKNLKAAKTADKITRRLSAKQDN
ncbi:3-deoxy-D-arabinoheptulosonate-7-phosphate synthase [Maridesulfovibrio ferrireducens]|uniref:3-deoxy-D-arabinoheptulosonate-7-phosphate synthase n=1 Tax=Maridesulfovibrio ferrireducens TaxID=246191 RepID=A0A1G9ESV4_9BACT|nr:phospho-2-dehydro-3-deoxyheptonate aldolase [Maridesulfovibrio ferrireducens]SDK79220.1 3-deoxy-D-arabinoheptulosonate-7-phosphate synthase [Maridesulfovibrio ferrireducens]